MTEISKLFEAHLKKNFDSANKTLSALNYQGLILGSGTAYTYFEDDMNAPFQTNPHFAHWCPAKGPHHFIKYVPGKKPLLIYYSPDDFWHIHERLSNPFWAEYFDIIEVGTLDKIWAALGDVSGCVFIGNETKYAIASGIKTNCAFAVARLNWHRRIKTKYELVCIREANKKASVGHKAAHEAFLYGGSEYEIHMAYLQAIGTTDFDLPYQGIVGLNENAAVLHYHGREHKKNGNVLLIDSGASYLHYPADITRTYCKDNVHPVFKQLLDHVEQLQRELCSDVKIGVFFPDLHYKCHLLVSRALHEVGVFHNISPTQYDTIVEQGITKAFFPHGLGHMLGIQVHDIGGKQLDENGNLAPKLEKHTAYQSLRYLGSLEEHNVVTIEPGIYFIPMLLKNLKAHKEKSQFINWKLVEELIPFGGIRIEDEVVPTQNGAYNITREFLT